jgi:hypothetical protein
MERIAGTQAATFIDASELISRRGGKITSMRFLDEVYRHADGRIAERYASGYLTYLFVWPNRTAYDAHTSKAPYNVQREF